ncbi:MAG: hypothetical protein FJW40_21200 [Acidobacteria bacterium]|nr:hypothetical protein [Acidobacteriota bacterium]
MTPRASSLRPSRRTFLAAPFALHAAPFAIHAAATTEISVGDIKVTYEDHLYRAPIKFGGNIVDKVTLMNVDLVIHAPGGKTVKGFASMPMGNVWSFPSKKLSYDVTLNAMRELAGRIQKLTANSKLKGHPIDINVALEPEYLKAAAEVTRQLKLAEPIPKLCTLVTASPFDAAVHDAYGKLMNRSAWQTYGPDCIRHDLAHYLTPEFKGEYLNRYVLTEPKRRMPMYHLVGAVDPIEAKDITKRVGDGLPETLPEWIEYNGLVNLKIKLNGDDLAWDVNRVLTVDRVASQAQNKRGVKQWVYSLDFNEKCPSVKYLLDFLRQIKEKAPAGFDRVQYVEQPTARDLKANRQNVMHEAAKLKPVVIDESLTELEALQMAREMGYSGTALKACKGQSQTVLMAAAAQKYKMFLCVQDLTCPGASLLHSASVSAHIPGVAGIEANSRQYVPVANKAWEKRFPGIFVVKDGHMDTSVLNGKGLGVV